MFPSRKRLCLLMLFSCIVVRECEGGEIKGYSPPFQCNNVDCPKYTVIHSEKEFEIRNYSQALWVASPTVVQSSIMGGLGKGVTDLTWYYHHENDQGVNIVAGGAVMVMDILNSTYTVNFYVPYKYQNGDLPKPRTPQIKQVKLPKYKYAAVRRVDGVISDDAILAQLDVFKKILRATTAYQWAAARDQFTFVLYNSFEFAQGYELLIWFD